MENYQGISFSMKNTFSSTQQADIVAFDQCSAFALPDASVMLKSHRSGMRLLVPADMYGLLQNCAHYQTIAKHVKDLISLDPSIEAHKDQISQVLEDLKNQGLMDSGQRLISQLKSAAITGAQTTSFAGTFIRTCDRPEQLKRLLESLSNNQQRHQHQCSYIVVDDSKNPGAQQKNQAICSDYQHNASISVQYYGIQQQAELITRSSQAFPNHSATIHWLLSHDDKLDNSTFTGGRILNHIVLLAAGQHFTLFDDDAVCQPIASPQMQHRWSFSSNPKDCRFYQDRNQMLTEIQSIELDPLTQHLDVLGKPLATVIKELSAVELSLNALRGVSSASGQIFNPQTPILITRNGTFGDPGTTSMAWVYQQPDHTQQQLTEDHEKYKQYLTNRTAWLGSQTFRAVNENALMTTTLTGIDGSQLMPPTGPCYRNEDYLFSRLLKFIHPSSLMFEFPWGLPHLPEPSRQWNPETLDEAKTVGILGFMADIANNTQRFCLADSPQQRLSYIGETYRALADAKLNVLADGIDENILNARTAIINDMQSLLSKQSDQPTYWINDLQRIINANQNALAQPKQDLFPDVGAGDTREQQVKSCQQTLKMFGNALTLWPELWEYCKHNSFLR